MIIRVELMKISKTYHFFVDDGKKTADIRNYFPYFLTKGDISLNIVIEERLRKSLIL